ncbi:hypothetical protein C8F04DRAFT_1347984 [Mycena alexandri]|uniref:Uncharacterized protein n=1 Tax=Mycena alexandri TaxID=1745969 RepID=A0AAD6WPL4_9AGAR|nr:hypothetical protein C8F04DRAFT_1347984 [Mycena alexandri]
MGCSVGGKPPQFNSNLCSLADSRVCEHPPVPRIALLLPPRAAFEHTHTERPLPPPAHPPQTSLRGPAASSLRAALLAAALPSAFARPPRCSCPRRRPASPLRTAFALQPAPAPPQTSDSGPAARTHVRRAYCPPAPAPCPARKFVPLRSTLPVPRNAPRRAHPPRTARTALPRSTAAFPIRHLPPTTPRSAQRLEVAQSAASPLGLTSTNAAAEGCERAGHAEAQTLYVRVPAAVARDDLRFWRTLTTPLRARAQIRTRGVPTGSARDPLPAPPHTSTLFTPAASSLRTAARTRAQPQFCTVFDSNVEACIQLKCRVVHAEQFFSYAMTARRIAESAYLRAVARTHTPSPRMNAVSSPPSHFRLARTPPPRTSIACTLTARADGQRCADKLAHSPQTTLRGQSSRPPPRTPTANAAATSAHARTTVATGIAEVVHTPPPRFAPHPRTRALMNCAAAHYTAVPSCPPVPAAAAHSNRNLNRRAAPTRTAVVAAPYPAATRIARVVLTPPPLQISSAGTPAWQFGPQAPRCTLLPSSPPPSRPRLHARPPPPHISGPHRAHPLRRLARTTPPPRPCTRTHEPHDRGAQYYRLVATIAPRVRKASHAVTPGRPGCDQLPPHSSLRCPSTVVVHGSTLRRAYPPVTPHAHTTASYPAHIASTSHPYAQPPHACCPLDLAPARCACCARGDFACAKSIVLAPLARRCRAELMRMRAHVCHPAAVFAPPARPPPAREPASPSPTADVAAPPPPPTVQSSRPPCTHTLQLGLWSPLSSSDSVPYGAPRTPTTSLLSRPFPSPRAHPHSRRHWPQV